MDVFAILPLRFPRSLVSIEKIHETLRTVFDYISKHLEFLQKYSAARPIFNSLLGVWKYGQIRFFLFDILHLEYYKANKQIYQRLNFFD